MRHSTFPALLVLCSCLFLSVPISHAQSKLTIHVLHPWADDTQRVIYPPYLISSETGWYPGLPMASEGGNWYTLTLTQLTRTSNERLEFASYIPTEFNEYDGGVKYPAEGAPQLILATIFETADESINEVWIIPSAGAGTAQILFTPPSGGKVINFLNPWDLGAPRIRIGDYGTAVMRSDRRLDRCGWFSYHFFGDIDSTIPVLFMNSLDSTFYGKAGYSDTIPIEIIEVLATADTVWIHARTGEDSVAVVSAAFPGIKGPCLRTIDLAVTMRDIGEHPDFDIWNALSEINCAGVQTDMVESRLGADGKPVKKEHECPGIHTQFDWFETKVLTDDGLTNETCYNLTLTANEEGIYEYDTSEFFPLDDFLYLDPERTVLNPNNNLNDDPGNPPNNIHFTMELAAQFEYHKGQTFYFRGDDDVWVFIDSELVVDLGGVHGASEGAVDLDTLGLTQGTTYSFKLFFTERNCCGSNFLMQTSINLTTSARLFWVKTTPAQGQMQFDLFERISQNGLACNAGETDVDTVDAAVNFFIEGPQFAQPELLPNGLSYGGIYVSNSSNILTIDTSIITGLAVGFYTITFQLMSDPTQQGQVSFLISRPPKPNLVQNPVVAAAYFTDNGYGQVTRAEIRYTTPLVKLPDSVVLYWPEPVGNNRRVVIPGSGLTLDPADSTHITVVPATPFAPLSTTFKGTPSLGTSYIFDTTFAQPNDVARFDIADSVGPLLMSALMPEYGGTGPDTFFLTFSEPIDEQKIVGVSLLLKPSAGEERTLTIDSFTVRFDTLVAFIPADIYTPAPGDSLRLAPTGNITDRFANHAHPLNRPVPILIRKAPPKVIATWYTDPDADGIVDRANFRFDRPCMQEDCSFKITWIKGLSSGDISGAALTYGSADSTLLQLDLSTVFTSPLPVATSGVMSYQLTIGFSETTQSGSCSDSAAPVLLTAEFHPAVFDSLTASPDTLHVTFSEPVETITSTQPFVLVHATGGEAVLTNLQSQQQLVTNATFITTAPLSDTRYPQQGDSVHINPAGAITDLNGNIQDNPDNRNVLLDLKHVQPEFTVIGSPNPFDPLKESFGIRVDPFVRGRNDILFRVQLTVYDKVGLLVAKKDAPEDSPWYTSTVTVYWNGRNSRGRIVGNGTYIGLVTVSEKNSTPLNYRLKIGVRSGTVR